MKRKMLSGAIIIAMAVLLVAAPVLGAEMDVEVSNATGDVYFTPLLVTAHDNATHLFQAGTAASAGLEIMAECGDTSTLLTSLGGADDDTVDNPASGLLAPGASTTAIINTNDTGNTHISIVAMLLPTNDGFVGLDALEVPVTAGTYTYYLKAYDAGTEGNDELITSGCDASTAGIPADPTGAAGTGGTGVAGVDSNTTVHIHRGTLGDTNASGGASDLDSTVHRWLNPVAKVVITVN